jgi:ATP-dependent DNA helicase RecG
MPSLLTPIKSLKGIGPALACKFSALGVETLEDALFYFPFRHEDWRQVTTIAAVQAGVDVTINGEIEALRTRRSFRRRRMSITEVKISDGTATLPVVWFNQPYLQKTFQIGDRLFISGRVERHGEGFQMVNPAFEKATADPSHRKLVPIYSTVEGLSQRQIRSVMKMAVELAGLVPDHLPPDLAATNDLIGRNEALKEIHFPATPDAATKAVRRLQFDELLVWQLKWLADNEDYRRQPANSYPFNEPATREFVQSLPFELTSDQRICAWQILQDLGLPEPMSRLLQGDVGSGKTVVAAIAAQAVIKQGGQAVFLVPTIVLAQQHFQTLNRLFAGHEVAVALVTGEVAQVGEAARNLTRRALATAVRDGEINIVVGTQALIESPLPWRNLGLVVVDEQQRFGVAQRDEISAAVSRTGQAIPHYLSLTATPIPRTLALFLAGELKISRLANKPAGRGEVITTVVTPDRREQIDAALNDCAAAGHQAFVITPLIEESDHFGARAAVIEHERLRARWPRLKIGLLHGAMPAKDRLAVMQDFRQQKFDVLVSTTVIEVGIDIPQATLMIIEAADRFGLAQLHQLRGRIGRGQAAGRCLLVTDRTESAVLDRLNYVAKNSDGLALAERDLAERGSGELYGLRQSGLPDWRLANLSDEKLMTAARQAATWLHQRGQAKAVLMDEDWKAPAGMRHRE